MSDVRGMDELLKNLKTLPEKVQKRVLVGAVRAAAKPIVAEIKNLVPKNTGNLKKSIGITKKRTRKKSIVWFSVSPRTGGKYDGWYGRLIELGTANIAAKPFMRPAFEKEGDKAIVALKEYMEKRLDKELAK